MPIRHQSDRSDISSDRGRTSPGSCPSTKEAPSNQDGLHRIQVILKNQEVFGRTLRDLNATRVEPKDASRYTLQFLRGHFEKAGRPATEWMEFVEDGWRRAWEQFEGIPRGFASDVQAAWNRSRRESRQTVMVGTEWRCALVLSSIRSGP